MLFNMHAGDWKWLFLCHEVYLTYDDFKWSFGDRMAFFKMDDELWGECMAYRGLMINDV